MVGPLDELAGAVAAKAATLRREHDLERHLGVLVDRWDVLNESGATPLPQIPEEIDFLWIVHRWEQGYDWLPTWVARRGETTWRVHAEVAT
jgi:hypothetical protein